jgi:hypothetical protein
VTFKQADSTIAKAASPVSFPLSLSQVPNNLKFVMEYLPEKKNLIFKGSLLFQLQQC